MVTSESAICYLREIIDAASIGISGQVSVSRLTSCFAKFRGLIVSRYMINWPNLYLCMQRSPMAVEKHLKSE